MAGAPVQIEQFQGSQAANGLVSWQADAGFHLRALDQIKLETAQGVLAQGRFVYQFIPVARLLDHQAHHRPLQFFGWRQSSTQAIGNTFLAFQAHITIHK